MSFRALSFLLFLFILKVPEIYPQELSPEEIYRNAQASVLRVYAYNDDSVCVSSGSAVLVSSEGLVYSVFHVFNHGSWIKLFSDGKELKGVKIIGLEPLKDILILKIPPTEIKPVTLGNSDRVHIGEVVYTVGNPKGYNKTFAEGMLSNFTIRKDLKHLQFSAGISPGSSGGALLNKYGELIGITASCNEDGQNLNFAVPVNEFLNTETIDINDSVQSELLTSIAKLYKHADTYPAHHIINLYNLLVKSGIHVNSVYRSVGRICYDGYLRDTAFLVYSDAINYFPDDKYFYVQRAICFMEEGKYGSAETDFQKAIELDSNYYEIYFNRSILYNYHLHNFTKAVNDYTRALELKPEYDFLYYYRAMAYLNDGDTANALKDLEISAFIENATAYDYYSRGLVYKDLEMYDEAILDFTIAIEKEARTKEYYFNRAIVYSLARRYELSVLDYLKYIELASWDPAAYNNLAWGYYNLGEFELAEKNFNKALRFDLNHFDAYIGLSVTYLKTNSIVKCKRSMYQAIKRAGALNMGMKGLEQLKQQGFFWTESEKRDIKKVFILMGIEEKEDIEIKPRRRNLGRHSK